jgi:hypothetical protein
MQILELYFRPLFASTQDDSEQGNSSGDESDQKATDSDNSQGTAPT